MKNRGMADLVLIFITFVWGITFVLVQDAISMLPPFLFLSIRFGLAALLLFLYIRIIRAKPESLRNLKRDAANGFILGIFLFGGFAFQTFSLLYTTSGKSGFLTGVSVALVPVFSFLILKSRVGIPAALGVACALVGLYLLAFADFSSINTGDVLAFVCAIFFALQIVYTGKYSGRSSMLYLVAFQLTTVSVLSGIASSLFDPWRQTLNMDSLFHPTVLTALAVTSVFATVLAFIAQTQVQKYTSPTRVALIFSLEPVFAALADYVWKDVALTGRSLAGCLLILGGMVLSELPATAFPFNKRKMKQEP
jgi:drug/metabolite transporter (DMT)-like permease